jgi:hypothetical protein
MFGEAHLLIIIIRLLASVCLCAKEIPLSGFHCINKATFSVVICKITSVNSTIIYIYEQDQKLPIDLFISYTVSLHLF